MLTEADATQRCYALYEHARLNGLSSEMEEIPDLLPSLTDPNIRGQMAKLFGVYAMRKRDYETAVRYHDLALHELPGDREVLNNCLASLVQLKRFEDVVERGQHALANHPDAFDVHDAMLEALFHIGRLDEARRHGTLSLVLKDRGSVGAARDLSNAQIPPFDSTNPRRNIIAFSLFGAGDRYCSGAIENARGRAYLYPAWTCRFYADDSVPADVTRQLAAAGAEVTRVTGLPAAIYGTFWRYLVADDPAVDRFLIRDADSVINTRERVAVDEWLDSGRHFHVMRDHVLHAELVLAGMWGGVRNALPALLPAIRAFAGDPHQLRGRTADQVFLRDVLWPTIRQSAMTHDSQFGFGERQDFPRVGKLPKGRSVGDYVIRQRPRGDAPA